MARRHSKTRHLGIWINGQRLGQWSVTNTGESLLSYDSQWVESDNAHPLSLSLPLRSHSLHRGQVVENYFDNLLPDRHQIRRQLAQHYRAPSTGVFDLLEQIGRDCVGAVQLLADDAVPEGLTHIKGQPLSESQIANLLKRLGRSAASFADIAGHSHDLRLSIAGAQDKTALLWHDGQWVLPEDATPTTHILKLPLGHIGIDRRLDMSTSVENEWLCLRILAAFGLDVPKAAMLRFEDQKVLALERFDRQMHASGRWWLRLPQEDFCQVTATPPHLKYESEGGPGIETIGTWLQDSVKRQKDLSDLVKSQMIFWMLAATDGHAKNFSIQLMPGGSYFLTPFYDVLSAWPVIGKSANKIAWQKVKLAMAVKGKNRHYNLAYIRREHFVRLGHQFGLFNKTEPLIEAMILQTPKVIETVSRERPDGFPEPIFDAICSNLAVAAKRLEIDV